MNTYQKLLIFLVLCYQAIAVAADLDAVPCMAQSIDTPATFYGLPEALSTVRKLKTFGAPIVPVVGTGIDTFEAPTQPTVRKLKTFGAPTVPVVGSGVDTFGIPAQPTVRKLKTFGAPVPVVVVPAPLGADERAYNHTTHDVFARASHKAVPTAAVLVGDDEAVYKTGSHKAVPTAAVLVGDDEAVYKTGTHEAILKTTKQALEADAKTVQGLTFELDGALAFAEELKGEHARLSALITGGGSMLDTLADAAGFSWSGNSVKAGIAAIKAGVTADLAGSEVQATSDAGILAVLEGADKVAANALLKVLADAAAQKDTTRADGATTEADNVKAVKDLLGVRFFVRHVGA